MALDATSRAPYFIVALLVFGLFYLASKRTRSVLLLGANRAGRGTNFSALVSRLGGGALLLAGALVASTIAFPAFTPATIFSVLGFGGVAAGFALRDILGNLLCGLVILASEPFRIGDRIARRGIEDKHKLERQRCVVERTFAWLARYRRRTIRYERRAVMHQAFLDLACAHIGLHFLRR